MENTTSHPAVCTNCQQELPAADVIFCPHCGQKNNDGKVGMRDFLVHFFEHFTHLDNKFVRTVHDLFVPGKMTEVYFRGKRKRYPNPVQLFFIVMFFFLIAANYYSHRAVRVGPSKEKWSASDEFFRVIQHQSNSLRLRQLVDSLPAEFRDAHSRQAIDSLLLLSHDTVLRSYQQTMMQEDAITKAGGDTTFVSKELWRQWPDLDSISISFGYNTYLMSLPDVAWLSAEELADKYQVSGFRDRLLMERGINLIHNPNALAKAYFSSFSWTILILVGLIAAFMFLLYRRQRRYYVEHFVFLMHWHSGILLLLALVLLLGRIMSVRWLIGVIGLWAVVSLYWALHRYYRGSRWSTAWRWLVMLLVYLAAFSVVFVGALIVVFLFS